MERTVVWSTLVVFLILAFLPCSWSTIHTANPGSLSTILAGVSDGDTVNLEEGVYSAAFKIAKSIVITANTRGSAQILCADYYAFEVQQPVHFSNIAFANCSGSVLRYLVSGPIYSTIQSCDFYGHYGSTAALVINFGNVVVSDTKFDNNTFAIDNSYSNLTMTRVTFTNNYNIDHYRAAIYSPYGSFDISDSTFSNNYGYSGGAIYMSESSGVVTNTYFGYNQASYRGGIFYTMLSSLALKNCTFEYNSAPQGGVIYSDYYPLSQDTTLIQVENCAISHTNTTTYAALMIRGPSIYIASSTFTNNFLTTVAGSSPSVLFAQGKGVVNITDSIFAYNTGASTMYLENVTLLMTRTEVSNNTGNIYIQMYSPAYVYYSQITNNYCISYGGAFSVQLYATLFLYHSVVRNNSADPQYGGSAVYTGANLYVHNTSFLGNKLGGSPLVVITGYAKLTNLTFSNNGAYNYAGGAVTGLGNVLGDCKIELYDSIVTGNIASLGGGFYTRHCVVQIERTDFIGNSAINNGGAMGFYGSKVSIANCTMMLNTANSGGGIYFNTNNTVDIHNSSVTQNTANVDFGGGVFVGIDNDVTIQFSEVSKNYAGSNASGGGVYCKGTLSVIDTSVKENEATRGAGIYADHCSLSVSGSLVLANKAREQAGGMYGTNSHFQIDTSIISFNGATLIGGGLFLDESSNATMHYTIVSNNTAALIGGGAYVIGTKVEFISCTFTKNYAARGGALYMRLVDNSAYIGDSGITGNYANTGDGIFLDTVDETKLRIQRTTVTNSAPNVFLCCSGVKKNSTQSELCSFPACNNSQCLETTGNCECPFGTSGDYNTTVPILDYTNTTCTCVAGWTGIDQYCHNVYDMCEVDPTVCDPLTTCTAVLNTPSFSCSACPNGYEGTGELGCHDADECRDGTATCKAYSTCNNTIGNYTCPCDEGFDGDGFVSCTDIDECDIKTAQCLAHSTCNNTIASYNCDCDSGYEGDGKIGCTDVNECTKGTATCKAHATCNNTIGGYECPCDAGYEGDGFLGCTDIEECTNGTAQCLIHSTCRNIPGGYSCDCDYGYEGAGKVGCTDINECTEGTAGCLAHSTCVNTIGNYSCICENGFEGDGRVACIDIDECTNGTSNCLAHSTCNNTLGNYTCDCNTGYDGDGKVACTDVDECSKEIDKCVAHSTCDNTIGGYTCTCDFGFSGDGKVVCEDTDECNDTAAECLAHSTCNNTIGNYTCDCDTGYEGDGKIACTDINECTRETDKCLAHSTCQNTMGNYTCNCDGGYEGDGKTACTDIDECSEGTAKCLAHSTCRNTPGDYTCDCDSGYEGDGKSACTDTNECVEGTNVCLPHSTCYNTIGNYTCPCDPGYDGDGKIACADIDECTEGTAECLAHSTCVNTVGNFTCDCVRGFTGDGKIACTDVDECELRYCDSNVNCTNTVGNYTCTECPSGYYGSGYTKCIFIDVCHPNPCRDNMICNELGSDSYNCSCMSGFKLQGAECIDINECSVNNGGCDNHVTCNNTIGGFECPPCPPGMTGNSSTSCTSLCGNDVCEPLIGETCVTCLSDCRNTTCNACGDGHCNVVVGENCTSCYEDCYSTCPVICDKCVNGDCNSKGACICFGNWSGPACDVNNQDIDVDTNTTTPEVKITVNQASFSVGIIRLEERTDTSELVSSINLASGYQNFTFLGNLTTGSSHVSKWSYAAMLINKAVANFTFYKFEQATNLSFANQNFSFSPQTLKFNVNVSSWPFKNLKNSLAVVLESYGSGTGNSACGGDNSVTNSGDVEHLQWVKITHQGTTLYGQFSDVAVVDGRNRNIKFTLNESTSLISAVLPHFWSNAEFDPAYSVLIDVRSSSDEACLGAAHGSSGTSTKVVIGVTVGVVGGAIAVAAIGAFVLYKKRQNALVLATSSSNVPLKGMKKQKKFDDQI